LALKKHTSSSSSNFSQSECLIDLGCYVKYQIGTTTTNSANDYSMNISASGFALYN
jgi:hypothetical protein